MTNSFSLAGKVGLVTGSSRGIGWAVAQLLAASGAHVVLNGRDRPALDARVDALSSEGLKASAAAFDTTDERAVVDAVAAIAETEGRFDILVANAGIAHRAALHEHPIEDFRRVIETNLTACFTLAREASKAMRSQESGRIIFVASIMGQIARPGVASYVASKGGLASLCKALAVELGPEGITCNAICPGFTATDMTRPLQENAEFNEWVVGSTPLRRWAAPPEIAAAALFLASDSASFVTGHLLTVDGGFSINA